MIQALLVGFGVIGFTLSSSPAAVTPGKNVASGLDAAGQVVRPPSPVSPLDGDTVLTVYPTLVVDAGAPGQWYQFRVMEEASIAAEGYSLVPVWCVAAAGRVLQRGHVYHWSCRVWDQNGWSPWFSPDWHFTVGSAVNPPCPKLPENGAVVPNRRPVFSVVPVMLRVTYHFQVWDGKTLVAAGRSDLPVWRTPVELEPGTRYSWTCRIEAEDTSAWFAPTWTLSVRDLPTVEDAGATGLLEPPAASAFPNPFATGVELRPGARLGRVHSVAVFAGDGRLVRKLAGGRLFWDGGDQAGRQAGPGTYFCRLVGDSGQETLRVLKVE
jgi:hypothetical protein